MLSLAIFLLLIPLFALFAVYLERKISAFIQDRTGPNRTGPFGLLQTLADILKLLQKESITPAASDKLTFLIAPMIVFAAILAGYATLPLNEMIIGASIHTGLIMLMAVISLDVIGLMMAGWGSNNKYSMLGAMRSIAQIISYEVPIGLCILTIAMYSGSLDLMIIAQKQSGLHESSSYFMGFNISESFLAGSSGLLSWNIFQMPLLFITFLLFFIAGLAESNRAPFDLPEGESEIIGGFHTEYGGFRFALLFLSEYGMMLLLSLLSVIMFLGAWYSPLPNIGTFTLADWTNGAEGSIASYVWSAFWLLTKTMLLIFFQMQIRWTFPRMRMDQMMEMCWKYLTPISLLIIFLLGFWKVLM